MNWNRIINFNEIIELFALSKIISGWFNGQLATYTQSLSLSPNSNATASDCSFERSQCSLELKLTVETICNLLFRPSAWFRSQFQLYIQIFRSFVAWYDKISRFLYCCCCCLVFVCSCCVFFSHNVYGHFEFICEFVAAWQ